MNAEPISKMAHMKHHYPFSFCPHPSRSFLVSLFVVLLIPVCAQAQRLDDIQPATTTVAIRNAEIVVSPGQTISRGTVLIEDGLITEAGTRVTIPPDAEIIEGDSLVVYAGFIDGLSHVGIPEPSRGNSQGGGGSGEERVNRANPPDDQAGIQPDRSAHEMLKADHASIDALRKAGFTVAHVVPHGEMLPGKGAIIMLAGDSEREMVLQRDVSMFAQIEGANRVYPATPMGVMAKMRQLYRESMRRKQLEARYASSASGIQRPEYDPVHYSFFPVIDGDLPIFMYTEDALDIYRALRLHTELGYPLILGGLYQGFESVDILLDADVPLFMTLKLPKLPDEKGAKKDTSAAEPDISSYNPALHVTDHTAIETERVNLEARQQIFYKEHLSTAASLYNSGLNFGFTTKEVKPDEIHKNLRTLVENGLPEDAALAALTTNAASTLGLSRRMGTVEKGKMANLVVTSGPLFDKESYIKYVFVDGKKFEYNTDAASKKTPGEPTPGK